jgi:asparagine synthase (glutamine-hydrolysing)
VIRDCSGKIPCYRTRVFEIDIVFSDINDLALLDAVDFAINWEYIAAFMASSQIQVRQTAIKDITEVLAGDRVTFSRAAPDQHSVWDPRQVCREDVIDDYGNAASNLLRTTKECIGAWASVHDSILHSLSGGFDSAVVLGCLRCAPVQPAILCMNRYGDNPAEDERSYARLAAARSRVRLVEHPWEIGNRVFDARLFAMPRAAKPHIGSLFSQFEAEFLNDLSRTVGFESIWTGQGGDHLFCAMRTTLGVADFFQRFGIRRGLWEVIADASRLTGDSVWHILQTTRRRRGIEELFASALAAEQRLVNREAMPNKPLEYIRHPWTRETEDLPVGKSFQISFLSELLNRHRPMPGLQYEDEHHPLLSQPIIELCLRIPVYLLLKGGRTRGLAREAFRDVLPKEIAERPGKGRTTSYVLNVFRRSQKFIRELILNGELARHKLLDRHAVESLIGHPRPLRPEELFPLMSCIAAEVFVQTWSERAATSHRSESAGIAYH